MDFSRNERIAEEIKKNVSEIINNDLKDPRIEGLISVTKVDVTKDLRHAMIYISLFSDETKRNETFEVIKKAKGFIRHELAGKMRMKYIPEIDFKMDSSIEYGIRINELLKQIKSDGNSDKESE